MASSSSTPVDVAQLLRQASSLRNRSAKLGLQADTSGDVILCAHCKNPSASLVQAQVELWADPATEQALQHNFKMRCELLACLLPAASSSNAAAVPWPGLTAHAARSSGAQRPAKQPRKQVDRAFVERFWRLHAAAEKLAAALSAAAQVSGAEVAASLPHFVLAYMRASRGELYVQAWPLPGASGGPWPALLQGAAWREYSAQ